MSGQYLTIKEAAKFSGRSTNTIRRAIKRGDLIALLVKGKYQVLVSSLVNLYELAQPAQPAQSTQSTQDLAQPAQSTQSTQDLAQPVHELAQPAQPAQPVHELAQPPQSAHELTHHALGQVDSLIGILRAELKAKDDQLKAKDDQIAELTQALQTQQLITVELAKPQPTLEPPASQEPIPEPKGKGFWARIRGRLR